MKCRFPSLACLLALFVVTLLVSPVGAGIVTCEARPLYTTVSEQPSHIVPAGGELGGVAKLSVARSDGNYLGSGVLLTTGLHLLTAAHLVTDDAGELNTSSATAWFSDENGPLGIGISAYYVHPDWDGEFFGHGNDIAVVELDSIAPADIDRYEIYTGSDEVGQIGNPKTGYGESGTGDTGSVLAAGTKRAGQNKYDSTADMMLTALGEEFLPGSVLQYDFDNGLAANDAFGFFFGSEFADLGLGADEVMSAPGDSGGPTFIDGKIAGITSYGVTLAYDDGSTSDVLSGVNNSFGEFGGDTRVSFYQSFINNVLSDGSKPVIPEPSSVVVWGVLAGLAVAISRRRRKRRSQRA